MSSGYWETGRLDYLPSFGIEVGDKAWKSWTGTNTSQPRRSKLDNKTAGYRIIVRTNGGRTSVVRVPLRNGETRASAAAKQKTATPNAYSMTHTWKANELVTYRNVGDLADRQSGALERFGSSYVAYVWDPNQTLQLLSRLKEAIVGSEFNAGVFLAELPQSLHLIGDTATKLAYGIHYLRRKRWRDAWEALVSGTPNANRQPLVVAKHLADSVADRWISMQYGWRPLVGDLDALAKQVANEMARPLTHTVRASYAPKPELRSAEVVYGTDGTLRTFCETVSWESRRLVTIFQEPSSVWQTQLTLPNLASIAWEKRPWSFVVDWALPIGTYVEARGATALVKAPIIMAQLNVAKVGPIQGPMNGRFYSTNFRRSILSDDDVPLPTVKPLNRIASWQHAANGLALLQLLGKGFNVEKRT